MSFSFGGPPSVPSIAAPSVPSNTPAAPPVYGTTGGSSPVGTRPTEQGSQPTFLGGGLTPQPGQAAPPSLVGGMKAA